MNLLRFFGKCISNRAAAWKSAKLVARSFYGRAYWMLRPQDPLHCRLENGGILLLEPAHSFTHCFWPAIDDYEPDVRAAIFQFLKPGATFLDCGANIGYFSVMAGKLVGKEGRVISVEANPVTYRLLQRNLVLNLTGEAVHCALTPTPGTLELFVPKKGGDVYSSTRKGGLVQGEEIEVIEVMGRTLDDVVSSLDLDRVDLIKIDIEGGELDVLQSAFRVLQEKRPVVICEYGTNTWPAFGASPQKLLRFLEECNYSVGTFDINLHTVRPATDEVWQLPYANLILQPR